MSIKVTKNFSRDGEKVFYKFELGRGAGQRISTQQNPDQQQSQGTRRKAS